MLPVRRTGRGRVPMACALVVIAGLLVAWPGAGAAQSPPSSPDPEPAPPSDPSPDPQDLSDVQKAEALFQEGVLLFNQGRFDEACPRFEASLAVIAGIGTRGKLAECWARVGRIASAYRLYLEVERLSRQDGDRERADVARQRARKLKPQLSYLEIVPGPSATSPGFSVTRNGLTVEPRTFDMRLPVDPGGYTISATAPGHQGWQSRVEVGKAEKKTVRVPALVSLATPDDDPGHASDVPGLGRITGLALVGVGTASLLGGTTFFALRARADWNDAQASDDCDDSGERLRCDPGSPGDLLADDAASSAQWANITAGVGLLALSAGVYLWLRSGPDAAPAPPETRSVHVAPALSPSSAGVVVWRRF